MYVQTMTFDDWKGTQDYGAEEMAPSLESIQSRIRILDGRRHTLIVLSGVGEAHMAIGGGEFSRYVVYATFDGQHFVQLRTQRQSAESDALVHIVAGGQLGEYPSELAVSLDEALIAAQAFASEGKLDPSLSWQA